MNDITTPEGVATADVWPGRRIRLIEIRDDWGDLFPPGLIGTVVDVLMRDHDGDLAEWDRSDGDVVLLVVRWDDGRTFSVVIPPDRIEVVG